jgi:hypothetical protein
VTISGYLGSGTAFDQAIARFAGSYAGQVTRDYDALVAGIWSGRIPAVREPVKPPRQAARPTPVTVAIWPDRQAPAVDRWGSLRASHPPGPLTGSVAGRCKLFGIRY